MKKLVLLTILFVITLILIIPMVLTFGIRYIPSGTQPSLTNTKKIYKDIILSQAFISLGDNLAGIGVSIKNPNFANKKNAYVNIYDSKGEVIRTIVLNGQNIADGKFVKILFEPIPNSKDKKFIWTFSSPESSFEDALEIFLTDNKPLWSLEFKSNGEVDNEGLSYVTLHKVVNPTEILSIVYFGWINNLVKDKVFFISFILILLTLLGSLVYLRNSPNLHF